MPIASFVATSVTNVLAQEPQNHLPPASEKVAVCDEVSAVGLPCADSLILFALTVPSSAVELLEISLLSMPCTLAPAA